MGSYRNMLTGRKAPFMAGVGANGVYFSNKRLCQNIEVCVGNYMPEGYEKKPFMFTDVIVAVNQLHDRLHIMSDQCHAYMVWCEYVIILLFCKR